MWSHWLPCLHLKPHLIAADGQTKKTLHPPRVELEADRKWVVEHHSANREIVIEKTDPKHAVYIYNCHNCVVQVGRAGGGGHFLTGALTHNPLNPTNPTNSSQPNPTESTQPRSAARSTP
jgi:hypothetical protein